MAFAVMLTAVIALAALFYGIKLSPLSWHLLGPVNVDSGLALKGYDPVTYFIDGQVVQGNPSLKLTWKNTTWYFSSEEYRQKFRAYPEKYQPQFGGYCARAVASGFTADVNPDLWYIEDGKLYLFYDEGARNDFISRISEGMIRQAETEWSKQ